MIVTKRFYCGADRKTGSAIMRVSLTEAVEDARQKLASDPRRDEVTIVQIIRIVRRAQSPVVVEDVTGDDTNVS